MAGLAGLNLGSKRGLRVAAYIRVSTVMESQDDSFESQRDFFLSEK